MTRAVFEEGYSKEDARLGHRASQLERRPDVGGHAVYAIEVFEVEVPVTVGDSAFDFEIPEDLDEAVLLKVEGYVNTASSSGSVQVQLRKKGNNGTGSNEDLLTDKITIEANELNSRQAATQPLVVTNGEEEVAWGDHIHVDVDADGTGALGLGVVLYFIPSALQRFAVRGATGPAGGVVNWTGEYDPGETYVENDVVSIGGSTYVAIVNNPTTTPGVDPGWEAEWMLLAGGEFLKVSSIQLAMSGNAYAIVPGRKAAVHVPFACTITKMTLLADVAGSVIIDIWKDTYGNYPPTVADSIVGGTPPTLSSAIKTQDTALSGWTTSLAEDDTLIFNVDSISGISFLTIALSVERV